jgi:hypothetical protein
VEAFVVARRAIDAGKQRQVFVILGVNGALVGMKEIERMVEKEMRLVGGVAEEENQVCGGRVSDENVAALCSAQSHEGGQRRFLRGGEMNLHG